MVPVGGPNGMPHPDVHASVPRHHDEGDVQVLRKLPAAQALVVHLDQPRECGRAALEQVVDIGPPVGRERIASRDHHAATGLEQDHHVSLDPHEELPQSREGAAAGAGAMPRSQPGGNRGQVVQRCQLDLEPAVARILVSSSRMGGSTGFITTFGSPGVAPW